ncbi:MAG: tetraacyldisaccharide 4'-kinase [Halieaceae bacterium]|nr:tetraacyldisaccharide 4'-kinase [Halieaceae bacterium]
MKNRLRQTLEQAWYAGAWWLQLLRPLELLFRLVAAARRGLYRAGLLPVYRAPVPVVVVGNITVGGTGKTPVVIALVDYLQARGIRVGVVSRGYGRAGSTEAHWVSSDSDPRQCGDEALLIQRRTNCPCVVAAARADAVRSLLDRISVDVIISDDGLQHYGLARDMEIALLDEQRRTGNGFCLPAGPLREPLARLENTDFVLYRGSADPRCGVQYLAQGLVNLHSGEQRPATPAAPGEAVFAVAGIGQPDQFFNTLARCGFDIEPVVFPDHHRYTASDFYRLPGKPIIMTEKDAVKCGGLAGVDAWYLKINAQLPQTVTTAVAALAQP